LQAETGMTHGAVRRVAEQLGYGVESVRSRVKQTDVDNGACGRG
jgi:transposase